MFNGFSMFHIGQKVNGKSRREVYETYRACAAQAHLIGIDVVKLHNEPLAHFRKFCILRKSLGQPGALRPDWRYGR
jgi:hypothetical protein